jgi:hypothetical protein
MVSPAAALEAIDDRATPAVPTFAFEVCADHGERPRSSLGAHRPVR